MSGISVVRGSSEPVDSASKWYMLCRADAFTVAAGNRRTRAVIVSVPAGVAEQARWKRKQREQLRSCVLYVGMIVPCIVWPTSLKARKPNGI